ncbi:hypothetical protein PGT21_021711 [Puccinia graminis f. sp. tritici]|uniref:Uncharacterized protein n=1 Tax=Puccinia graminis f. sp. tritici TaxID=56615 RepID=A0A5B0QAX3_PUCGR|nr:hypothetical protein PGT21_021711 [Puccinia graminis f. sp. tritici]
MVWYNKTELRKRFLALIEEKQPLVRVRRAGESSSIGTRGQQKLMALLRKHGEKLETVLASYTKQVDKYVATYPTRPNPPLIGYSELLELPSDDPFWNDGLFTEGNAAWAIDRKTQLGIRHLACLNRGQEELRRLGWETRRSMQWAINRNNKLKTMIRVVREQLSGEPNEIVELPELLRSIVGHADLQSNDSMANRLTCVRVILHAAVIKHMDLQLMWDPLISEILLNTLPQNNDDDIKSAWKNQLDHIHHLHRSRSFSGIPGDMDDATLTYIIPEAEEGEGESSVGINSQDQPQTVDDDQDFEEDDGQQPYLDEMESRLSVNMLNDLIQQNSS